MAIRGLLMLPTVPVHVVLTDRTALRHETLPGAMIGETFGDEVGM